MNTKPLAYLSLTLFLLVAPVLVHAAVLSGGDNVSITSPALVESNIYAGGGTVSVSVPVNGDVYTGGGTVIVSNFVRDDVVAAGGTVNVLGAVGGDVRVAGGTVVISKPVGGDLVVLGGTVRVATDVTIGGDVIIAGGNVVFDGIARKKVTITGGDVIINGQAQELSLKAGNVSINEMARIYGDVSYESPKEAAIAKGALIQGKINFKKVENAYNDSQGRRAMALLGAFSFAKAILFVVSGLILIFFFKSGTKSIVVRATDNFGSEFLRGLVAFFATPLIFVLLCFTLVGILPAFFVGALYAAGILLSLPLAGIVVGGLIEKQLLKKDVTLSWQWSILGILILAIVGSIPVIGFALRVLFYAAAFGAIVHGAQGFLQEKR